MRVYLCGQRHFGHAVLDLLLGRDDVEITGVSAPPVTSDGREDRTWGLATLRCLPRLPAGNLRAASLPEGTDLIVCAHSHDFIGRATRHRATFGAIGYHPSLLPLHRGRDAIRWTIRDRDRITGGTVFWLNDTVDGGPVAAQDWCFVRPDDTVDRIWRRELHPMGLRLISSVLDDIRRGLLVRIPQDPSLATWEPSIDAPPLYRPELPMLGRAPAGCHFVVERPDRA